MGSQDAADEHNAQALEAQSKQLKKIDSTPKPTAENAGEKGPFRLLSPFVGRTIPPVPKERPPYPEPTAGPWARFTYSWIYPVMKVSCQFAIFLEPLFHPSHMHTH